MRKRDWKNTEEKQSYAAFTVATDVFQIKNEEVDCRNWIHRNEELEVVEYMVV